MRILRTLEELSNFFQSNDGQPGCLADTGFLYGLSYVDDRLYESSNKVFDLLVEYKVPIYANVISRLEFVDLIFRKQITMGAIQLFQSLAPSTNNKSFFNLLKNIRDEDTAQIKNGNSYKVGEERLKKLRKEMEHSVSPIKWKEFCGRYVGQLLQNEWIIMEQELGLNFVEILEGEDSEMFREPLFWKDMVQVMGEQGLRGPDAMILNLFSKSKFPLLITGDGDFEKCLADSYQNQTDKVIFILS